MVCHVCGALFPWNDFSGADLPGKMDSYIIKRTVALFRKGGFVGLLLRCHASAGAGRAADVLLSVQVLGYTVPVITRVLVPGMTLHAPVSAFWVNVAAGTVISPALVVKSPVV